jgi:hypothetical protein
MIHLLAMFLLVLTLCFVVVLVCRVIWLCVLLVTWCLLAVITAILAAIIGCQKLSQVYDDWRWKRRYGEVLPPDWPDPWTGTTA